MEHKRTTHPRTVAHTRGTPPLGQHFLTRPEIAGWVADAAHVSGEETVLEIGPGHGILTRELLTRAKNVVAIERDRELADALHTTFRDEVTSGRLRIVTGDARTFDTATLGDLPFAVVANIPYYLTGRIIRTLLTAPKQPSSMTLLVQKEVAERIVAKNGKESLLSLSVKAYGVPEYVRTVKAGAFSPPPKVDSAILTIHHISRERFDTQEHEERFFTLMHTAFAGKRKKIRTTLRPLCESGVCRITDEQGNRRPEEIGISTWLNISN